MAESQFVYVTYIRTTPEKLWQALREPEFTRRFWVETVQESEWRPGAPWRIVKPNGSTADSGAIVECDPPRRLVLTWQNHMFPEMEAEGHSRLTYTLEPLGNEVKLTVIHEMERKNSKLIQAVGNGWPQILSSLKTLLETGEALESTMRWPKGL